MEKINLKIREPEGIEVYCASPAFGYVCDSTPNNCTECPVMRFLYHDLTTNVLDETSAAALKAIVEKSEAFSGKYTKAENLPPEVWSAIYTIRTAFYDYAKISNDVNLLFDKKSPCFQRFVQWFGKHGTIAGIPAGRHAVRTALHEMSVGKWLIMDPDDKHNKTPAVEYFSGTYEPLVFDDAAEGIRYLMKYLINKATEIDPQLHEMNRAITISQTSENCSIQKIILRLSINDSRAGTLESKLKEDLYYNLLEKLHDNSCVLEQIHYITASTYRNRYLNKVAQLQPDIEFTFSDEDYPTDPNHPIHQEGKNAKCSTMTRRISK